MQVGHIQLGTDGRMWRVDDALCAMMAQPAETMIGRSVLDITFPPDRLACARYMTRLRESAEPFTVIKRMLRRDGSSFWVTKTVALAAFGDTPSSVLATVTRAKEADADATPPELLRLARLLLDDIGARRRWMDSAIFVDPPSAILLGAYIAEAEGSLVDMAALADIAGVSHSVLVRWVSAMAAQGLIETEDCVDDAARSFPYRLTQPALDRCERYLARGVRLQGGNLVRA